MEMSLADIMCMAEGALFRYMKNLDSSQYPLGNTFTVREQGVSMYSRMWIANTYEGKACEVSLNPMAKLSGKPSWVLRVSAKSGRWEGWLYSSSNAKPGSKAAVLDQYISACMARRERP